MKAPRIPLHWRPYTNGQSSGWLGLPTDSPDAEVVARIARSAPTARAFVVSMWGRPDRMFKRLLSRGSLRGAKAAAERAYADDQVTVVENALMDDADEDSLASRMVKHFGNLRRHG